MQSSRFLLRGIVCLTALSGALVAQTQAVAVLPGPSSASTTIPVISTDPFATVTTISGVPQGAFRLLPKNDATKSYLITATAGGVTVLNNTLAQPRPVSGISATPIRAEL